MPTKTKKKNKTSVRFAEVSKKVETEKYYELDEAIQLLKETATAKFPESVDLAIRLGIDPRKSDQNVRGTTNLPHGTGRTKTVAVLAKGESAKEASVAGADFVGDEDLIKKIQDGWKDFDVMLATEDMAPQIGKIGRFLGPKTPNKRNGTVTNQIGQAVTEIKGASRIEYRTDKAGVVHLQIGKVNFTDEQIKENFITALDAVIRAKPSASKGRYLKTVALSSTMGPAIHLDTAAASKVSGH
ncbi:50S ribosomal protein L1 [Kamptonema cortianum]|nr:50S ribosomal protein L1 [Geitlerinema splendidum]MDK3157644.1 50S ribosomal protein L1 [Kamptonema cortianum]